MVAQSWYAVGIFLASLICAPWVIKRFKLGPGMRGDAALHQSKLVSTIAVGHQQKVVTVEVGPEGARTWLVLGVTGQQITCLHVIPQHHVDAAGGMIEK